MTSVAEPLPERVHMRHPDTGGETWIPGSEAVLRSFEARGWEAIDAPAEPAVTLPPAAEAGQGVAFTEWVLPANGSVARFPVTEGGEQAARDAGWVPVTEHAADAVDGQTVEEVLAQVGDDPAAAAAALAAELEGKGRVTLVTALEEITATAAADTAEVASGAKPRRRRTT